MKTFEEEIKQRAFKNDVRKAILNVIYTSNWIRDRHAHIFKEYGILQQHYNVLRIVKGRKGEAVSPGQILDVMLDKGRDLTRLVDKLVKKGLLVRKPSEINKRKVDITITEEGVKLTDLIEDRIEEWVQRNVGIDEEKANQLSVFLDQMRGGED